MEALVKLHPFEAAGLGNAPFVFVSMVDLGSCSSTCDACGTGIRYVFWIRSHDGKNSRVGIDCIRKISNSSNRLISEAERAMATHERKLREEKRRQQWESIAAKRELELQSQRDRNGGLTDHEVAENKLRQERLELTNSMKRQNKWLLDVLGSRDDAYGFLHAMITALETKPVKELSDRQVEILADIYAKKFGARRSSKKYEELRQKFFDLAGIVEQTA